LRKLRMLVPALLLPLVLIPIGVARAAVSHGEQGRVLQVQVPGEDRFAPFALQVHVGDSVKWTNNDSDDHTVVSDDAFSAASYRGLDHLLAASATFVLQFDHPGTFVYYCRFHAQLDAEGQPVAPGPDGGIQDPNGNYGTPMSGVITVLPNT
jgi:plastocyanin